MPQEPPLLKDAGNIVKHVAKLALPILGAVVGFQDGGTVPATGMYQLHEGEEVVPASGVPAPPGTPPTFSIPDSRASAAPIDEQTRRILAALTQAATQRRAAGTPRPAPVPGGMDPIPPASLTAGMGKPQANAQRFMYGIQANIRNGVARMKEQQIAKATADWEYGQSALNEYYAAQQSGDQQAMKAAQVKLDFAFGDPKKLKQMAKALNQDWLNPEKTTPYGEALKRVAAKSQQTDQQKQQAANGIKSIFQKLIQKAQGQPKPQLTDEDKKGIEQEVINRAPSTTGMTPAEAKAIIPFATADERVQAGKDLQELKDKTAKDLEDMKEKARKDSQKPVEKVLSEAQEAFWKGDMDTYNAKLKEAGQMSAAEKQSTNQFALIQKANAGDEEAAKTLKTYWDQQIKLSASRGEAFGKARAEYNIQPYYDENGKLVSVSALDAARMLHEGKTLTRAGTLPPAMVASFQRMIKEADPAIEQMYKTQIIDPADPERKKKIDVEPLKAFDDANDRAIFAKVLAANPAATYGNEASWLGNIMNQALQAKLSPNGRAYAENEARLAETLGTVRASMNLPSTDSMMSLAMSNIPGPSTPDSASARDKMGLLRQMVDNSVDINLYQGILPKGGGASAPQRPKNVPTGAVWNEKNRTWSMP